MGVAELNVKVDNGNVTLSGTTATYADKFEAADAAYRGRGVKSVTNNLAFNPAALGIRPDSDIRPTCAIRWRSMLLYPIRACASR